MLKTPLPEEVRNALLTYHIIQDDLLDLQILLHEIEDLPDGARYFTLPPGPPTQTGNRTSSHRRRSSSCSYCALSATSPTPCTG